MKFDDLDKKMRVFETSHDTCVLPEMYIVARIDGRGFTRLTKELHDFEKPFDIHFRDYMVETVKHLMNCGFRVTYAYTESDEISLLLDMQENAFGRKHRKLNSLLAGEASAKFSLQLGNVAAFDCRICELPNQALVTDYFRWRNEDAHRNALNAHCYWLLRNQGQSPAEATDRISRLSIAAKNELLFSNGINFNNLPSWQKRGVGIYWRDGIKEGFNPVTNTSVHITRRELHVEYELPMKEDYSAFIAERLADANSKKQ